MSEKDVASDVQRMIRREQEIMNGAKRMRQSARNPTVRQQLDSQLQEAARNLAYLEDRLKKLQTAGRPSETEKQRAELKNRRPEEKATRLDLLRYDLHNSHALMAPRIQLMQQQLEYKLSIEQQYKQATQKLLGLYKQNGDRRSRHEAAANLAESQAKITILSRSLKRYADMYLPAALDDAEAEDLVDNFKVPNTRRPISGTLHVFVREVADVDHTVSWTSAVEMWASVKADRVGSPAYLTRPSRSSQFNEQFNIPADRANEIEFSVYDREAGHTDGGTPVALMWLRIADVVEALRRKRVQRDLEASGWASAAQVQELQVANAPPRGAISAAAAGEAAAGETGSGSGSGSSSGSGGQSTTTAGAAGAAGAASGAAPRRQPAEEDVTVEGWFTLEPAGRVYLRLGFDRGGTGRKRPHSWADEQRLGRHNAIRKREETQEVHGHEMVHHQAYNIVRCSVCGDFATSHYQCQECELSCDRKCLGKIVTKCTALDDTAPGSEDDEELSHRIPHRFEPVTNMRANWCCHCGYILPLASKKNVRKCTECGVMCHAACARHVPNFCGMSMEMASQIVSEIKSTRIRQATKAVASQAPPKTVGAPGDSGVSSKRASTAPKLPQIHTQIPTTSVPELTPQQQRQSQHQHQYWPYGTGKPTSGTTPVSAARPPRKEPIRRKQVGSAPYTPSDEHTTPEAEPGSDETDEGAWWGGLHETLPEPPSTGGAEPQNPFQSTPTGPMGPLAPSDRGSGSITPGAAPTTQSSGDKHDSTAAQAAQALLGHPQTAQTGLKKRRRKVGLDDFSFLAVLGKGNFGKVMLAESKHSGALYAVKVLKKNFIIEHREVESTRSEKRVFLIANRERHPFLVNLMACFQTENRIYFVMEYISGGDLMYHIQKEMFTARRAQFYAAEVLLALKHFHENDVIYRDLKLDNILLGLDGHIKVADYGLCKEDMGYGKTTGTFCGTPDFIAPEILLDQKYGRSVDWWALGVLMYQMLLGKSPFHGADEEEVYDAILSDEPLYPIHMPRESVSILQQLLTRDPAKRLGSGPRDAEEIMEHPYFASIDFKALAERRVEPPYRPEIDSPTDVRYFDHDFTSEMPALTPMNSTLTPAMQEQFRGFSYSIGDSL